LKYGITVNEEIRGISISFIKIIKEAVMVMNKAGGSPKNLIIPAG